MADEELDKSNPATPYKLQKARERGNAARSQDAIFVAVLFGTTCFVLAMGWRATVEVAHIAQDTLFHLSREEWDAVSVSHLLGQIASRCEHVLAVPFAMVLVLAILAGVTQVGFTLSAEPLKPDFDRINPAAGLKRLLSKRILYELVRNVVKLGLVALLVYVAGRPMLGEFMGLQDRSTPAILYYMIHALVRVLAMLTGLFALLALIDLGYTRWEFRQKMRMSKREVKDEHKHREGDPRIKSRLRELRLEWFKRGLSMRRVKDADVLITNPTHLAVAIAYERERMAAPKILTKAAGAQALQMRKLARRSGVMIVENPPLARALFLAAEPGDWLPGQHYTEVAKILVWVFAARGRAPVSSPGTPDPGHVSALQRGQ